ncbi:hypothetical protein IV38_GL001316 [Lactobacillus selangorensis]|uniref:Uncharacterized protein n=1 Tax=Lactobacillus selangorensis TaxID=81857 RepID=A0A0R2FJ73_9LACO|nr:DUF1516 family protein [Lactobacillus selangorensis]KRN28318.1 hypothetical protein IV38_GL001316 [Lactobacillus selangorensis]KRN31820.1 hypothetical protein IV40_GL001103 [Lactobacillus selangorensis]
MNLYALHAGSWVGMGTATAIGLLSKSTKVTGLAHAADRGFFLPLIYSGVELFQTVETPKKNLWVKVGLGVATIGTIEIAFGQKRRHSKHTSVTIHHAFMMMLMTLACGCTLFTLGKKKKA